MSIKSARKKAGMTQMQVAKALNITDSAVNQWEKGSTFPTGARLKELVKVLDCSVDELLKED